jgi:hypothetical protein
MKGIVVPNVVVMIVDREEVCVGRQIAIRYETGTLPLGVKRRWREAENSPPSSADVKNVWSYTSTPLARFHGVVLS